jgi:hypothetical protein
MTSREQGGTSGRNVGNPPGEAMGCNQILVVGVRIS